MKKKIRRWLRQRKASVKSYYVAHINCRNLWETYLYILHFYSMKSRLSSTNTRTPVWHSEAAYTVRDTQKSSHCRILRQWHVHTDYTSSVSSYQSYRLHLIYFWRTIVTLTSRYWWSAWTCVSDLSCWSLLLVLCCWIPEQCACGVAQPFSCRAWS